MSIGKTRGKEAGRSLLLGRNLCYIQIHEDKMTDAAAHNKEMKYFMGAEEFVLGVENRELQCIDDASYGVHDATAQQPQECRSA